MFSKIATPNASSNTHTTDHAAASTSAAQHQPAKSTQPAHTSLRLTPQRPGPPPNSLEDETMAKSTGKTRRQAHIRLTSTAFFLAVVSTLTSTQAASGSVYGYAGAGTRATQEATKSELSLRPTVEVDAPKHVPLDARFPVAIGRAQHPGPNRRLVLKKWESGNWRLVTSKQLPGNHQFVFQRRHKVPGTHTYRIELRTQRHRTVARSRVIRVHAHSFRAPPPPRARSVMQPLESADKPAPASLTRTSLRATTQTDAFGFQNYVEVTCDGYSNTAGLVISAQPASYPEPGPYWHAFRVWKSFNGNQWATAGWNQVYGKFTKHVTTPLPGSNGRATFYAEFWIYGPSGWVNTANGYFGHTSAYAGGYRQYTGTHCLF